MNKKEHPYRKANFLSRLLYCWLNEFVKKGSNVGESDVYDILQEESSHYQCQKLEKRWEEELKKSNGKNDQWMLARALFKTYGLYVAIWSIVFFIQEIFKILQPFLIGRLIEYFSRGRLEGGFNDSTTAYLYAMGICLCTIIPIFILHHYFLATSKTAMVMRVSCCSLLYKKSLRLGIGSASSTTVAQLINLMSNDVSRFDLAISLLPFLIIAPLELVAVTGILWFYIGWGSLAGSLVLILIIPISAVLAKIFSNLRRQITKLTDTRLGLLTEMLNGIQYVKMCCWEDMMEKRIDETRRQEIKKIMLSGYARGTSLTPSFYSGKLIILAALLCHILTGNSITAQVVFVAMSMYNPVRFSLTLCFPMAMQMGAESLITIRRIQEFLMIDEMTTKPKLANTDASNPHPDLFPSAPIISAHDISISWNDSESPILSGVTFEMNADDLVIVIGSVGVGKTSLLMAILGELEVTSGSLSKQGCIAYVSQQAWIFNGTVRENILMGGEMRTEVYQRALHCSCLDKDLAGMSQGDQTRVGDRGMGLSGGQKARISLARAVYRDAQVYLMDDPLSAVDANVSLKLFELCINGCLRRKLRVLVTHQIQYLPRASNILYLDHSNEQRHFFGSFEELKGSGIDFGKMAHHDDELDLTSTTVSSIPEYSEDGETPLLSETNVVVVSQLKRRSRVSHSEIDFKTSMHSLTTLPIVTGSDLYIGADTKQEGIEDTDEELAVGTDEELAVGTAVPARTYMDYMTAGSGMLAFVLLLLLNIITQSSFLIADWWLVYWCNENEHLLINKSTNPLSQNTTSLINQPTLNPPTLIQPTLNPPTIIQSTISPPTSASPNSSTFYLGIYALLSLLVVSLAVFRALLSFNLLTKSNQRLHSRMLHNVIRCPISFFVANPAGRILNRFSKDMGHTDEMLPLFLFDFIQQLFLVLGLFVMLVVMNAWVLLAIGPMFVGFFLIRWYFLRGFRVVKRIEAKTKGPVFSHISATFHGLLTIRTHKAEGVFLDLFECLQDQHTASFSHLLFLSRWFAIRLEWLCGAVITVVTFAAVLAAESMDGASVGLSLSYSISLLWLFQWVVRQSTEVETMMTHVERLVEYTKLPIEEHYKTLNDHQNSTSTHPHSTIKQQSKLPIDQHHSHQPLITRVNSNNDRPSPDNWPNDGEIEFKDVCLAYKSSGPVVLKNLNFRIQPGEKIGIVGRTGAGKSSLINVIFKLVPFEGSVLIDGLNINEVSTFTVRNNISIIPQEQVMLSGTVRSNLDPADQYKDHQIWDSLAKVKLDTVFRETGLHAHVKEGGGNLSIGQQQLLCMSRVLLKKNKILLIDEATANVDRNTDSFIQATLREHFADLTVLTIAHRLITVIDCDKIMLMDEGRILEFDTPHNLLTIKQGAFYNLAMRVGSEELKRLQVVASARNAKNP